MDAIFWLVVANAIIWIGLGAYVAFLASRQNALARQLKLVEHEHDPESK